MFNYNKKIKSIDQELANPNKYIHHIITIALIIYGIGIPIISFIVLITAFVTTFMISAYFNLEVKVRVYQIIGGFLLFSFLIYYYSFTNYYLIDLKQDFRVFNYFQFFFLVFNPLCLYYFSQIISLKSSDRIFTLIVLILSAQALYNAFLIIYSIHSLGIQTVLLKRRIINIFTGEYLLATHAGMYLLGGISLFSVFIIKTKTWLRIISIITVLVSFIFSMIIQTRTPVFFGSAIVIIALVLNFISSSPQLRFKLALIYSGFFMSFVIFVFINLSSITNLLSIYFHRIFYKGLDSPRYESWQQGIRSLFEYPFGGMRQEYFFGFSHNLWLDIGSYAGFIPILLILLFQFQNLVALTKIHKSNKNMLIVLFSIICVYFSTFIVEPVIIASPTFFAFSVFFLGLIKKYSKIQVSNQYE